LIAVRLVWLVPAKQLVRKTGFLHQLSNWPGRSSPDLVRRQLGGRKPHMLYAATMLKAMDALRHSTEYLMHCVTLLVIGLPLAFPAVIRSRQLT